jgi:anti-anti-sigma regulatory factor
MTSTDVHAFESGELRAKAAIEEGRLRVTLAGCADSRVMTQMKDLVSKVHEEMVRTKTGEVVVDFRELEFMNSSCFKAFVTWISRVQELEPAAQYHIRLVSDRTKQWQHRSLAALRYFAVDLVQVDG